MSNNTIPTIVAVKEIKCELDRCVPKENFARRAETIKSVGLLHAVILKPINDKKYKYEVIAGRTSFIALTSILDKKELSYPDEIKFNDGDKDLIAFIENDDRKELTLWEQVDKLERLKNKFKTIETLAIEIGQNNTWVAKRINLLNLSDQWKEAMKEQQFAFSIGHYEVIATYSNDIQDEIYDYCDDHCFDDTISVRKFQKELSEEFMTLLSTLPWNKDGKETGCGECPACLERINGGFLFEEMNDDKKACCMNQSYLKEKMHSFLMEEVNKFKDSQEEVILVEDSYQHESQFDKSEAYTRYNYLQQTKKDGGQKALIVSGPKAGQYTYVKLYNIKSNDDKIKSNDDKGETQEKTVKTLDERKANKNRQRQRRAIDSLMEYINGMGYKIPCRDDIYALIACLEVSSVFPWGYDHNKANMEAHRGIAGFEKAKALKTLDREVWTSLKDEIVRELKYGQSGSVEAKWEEAEIISKLISFDLQEALQKATEALPDPKSWKKLEEQEKKAKEEKSADKKAA